jgi:hypothetical protein
MTNTNRSVDNPIIDAYEDRATELGFHEDPGFDGLVMWNGDLVAVLSCDVFETAEMRIGVLDFSGSAGGEDFVLIWSREYVRPALSFLEAGLIQALETIGKI